MRAGLPFRVGSLKESQMLSWLGLAVVIGALLLFLALVIYEWITAPLVDEEHRVISDPYRRMRSSRRGDVRRPHGE